MARQDSISEFYDIFGVDEAEVSEDMYKLCCEVVAKGYKALEREWRRKLNSPYMSERGEALNEMLGSHNNWGKDIPAKTEEERLKHRREVVAMGYREINRETAMKSTPHMEGREDPPRIITPESMREEVYKFYTSAHGLSAFAGL